MRRPRILCFIFSVSAVISAINLEAATGPHGGQVKPAAGTPGGYQLELVIKPSGNPEEKEIHVYGLTKNGGPANLYQSGFGGITFRLGKLELPLAFYKVDEAGLMSNDDQSIHHYRAVGKFPADPTLELEVTVAFPSKAGTGKAVFHPFAITK